ncbi:MAG: type IV pilus biogenesis protein PilM [Steroidobacteraceae bacterium]
MLPFKRTTAEGWRVGVMPTDRETALAIVRRGKSDQPLLRHCAIHPTLEIRAEHVLQPLNSNRDLARAAVSGVLGTNDYQLVQVEAPEVPPEELRSAVRWKLKDLIDYPVSEAVIDVFEIPENTRYVESRMVFAVAARAQAVQGVVNLLKPRARGFDVLDIPEMCLRNVSALLPQDESGVVLLALGEGFVQLTVTCRGVLYLARRIEMVRRLDLDSRGAEEREIDVTALALELQRSLDYYESHFDLRPITEVAVVAGDPRAEPLIASLHSTPGLAVTALEVPELFEVAPGVEPDTRWPGLLALGAALRGTERSAA